MNAQVVLLGDTLAARDEVFQRMDNLTKLRDEYCYHTGCITCTDFIFATTAQLLLRSFTYISFMNFHLPFTFTILHNSS